ncbi:hypothetical protein, partial [Streptomyces spectabilis]|uniref:hypothetical protein n=1 Tax=Streptomyces spectabilis TaxID=68270 RepID=UPI0033F9368A
MLIKPDPASPAGEAIIDLADQMDELQERTGEWPGADAVDILSSWLSRFTFATSTPFVSHSVGRAWVLREWNRRGGRVTLWSDEASALAELARQARDSWDDVAGTDGVPYRPPADDQRAVELFFGPEEAREEQGYTLYATDINRCVRTPPDAALWETEACAQANSAAVFYRQEEPGDEGLPCIEIVGVLVFVYLDADRRSLRVSVHLDTADDRLVGADGTVPMRVEVGDVRLAARHGLHVTGVEQPALHVVLQQVEHRLPV